MRGLLFVARGAAPLLLLLLISCANALDLSTRAPSFLAARRRIVRFRQGGKVGCTWKRCCEWEQRQLYSFGTCTMCVCGYAADVSVHISTAGASKAVCASNSVPDRFGSVTRNVGGG